MWSRRVVTMVSGKGKLIHGHSNRDNAVLSPVIRHVQRQKLTRLPRNNNRGKPGKTRSVLFGIYISDSQCMEGQAQGIFQYILQIATGAIVKRLALWHMQQQASCTPGYGSTKILQGPPCLHRCE